MEVTRPLSQDEIGQANKPDTLRYQPLIVVLLAVVLGIVLDRYVRPSSGGVLPIATWCIVWWCLAAACVCAWYLVWRRTSPKSVETRRERIAACLLLVGVALSAAAWHDVRWQLFSRHEIALFAPVDAGPACLEVVASEPPEWSPAPPQTPLRAIPAVEQTRLAVRVAAIRDGATWKQADGRCLLIVSGRLDGVRSGDRMQVFGQLSRAAPPLNPGEFDFAEYARSDRRLVALRSGSPAAVVETKAGARWRPQPLLDWVRAAARRIVKRNVGPERAALASAILLGDRTGLTNEETTAYLVTGTVHLLVVSGMNVAILAIGLHWAMRWGWLGRRTGLALIMAVVTAYTLLAGWQAPIVRAAVLAWLWCVAAWTGRRELGFNLLAAAALIVLVVNPADVFRAGPQLSFLAVAALIWVNQGLVDFRRRHPVDRLDQMLAAARPRYVRSLTRLWRANGWLMLTTSVIWLTALPLVLHRFHVLTPVTVLISPVIWIIVWVALWSGFLMLLFGGWAPSLAAVCGAACNASLAGLESVVGWAESLPAGHFWTAGPAWWWILGFYLGLMATMLWGRGRVPLRWQVAVVCAWIAVGCVPPVVRSMARDGLTCSFISVGHGTCVLVEGPGGETLLYDAGSLGSPDAATRTVSSYLWHRGILRIDGIVLSHADVDHYNAIPGLLERFRIGAIYVSPAMYRSCGFADADRRAKPQAALDGPGVLRESIERAGVSVRQIWAGDRLRLGPEVAIDVLHPSRLGVVGNDNANSITLTVDYAGRRVLLPGDLESPGLEDLTAEPPRDCDVLLAPHHGSRRSDPPGFAAWSTPEWVVISGGNVDVAPSIRSYEDGGATVFQTHLHGAVEIALSRRPTRVATWRGESTPLRRTLWAEFSSLAAKEDALAGD
ncbi:MAG: ComEC/Rec2 family competence protein [Pirellulales bacterium]